MEQAKIRANFMPKVSKRRRTVVAETAVEASRVLCQSYCSINFKFQQLTFGYFYFYGYWRISVE